MLFNSYEFIFLFLPLALTAHFLAARWSVSFAVIVTTVSSLIFYAWWKPPFVLLPIASIILNFLLARKILATDPEQRRALVLAGVIGNLLVLGYYKYADFILSVIEQRQRAARTCPWRCRSRPSCRSHSWSSWRGDRSTCRYRSTRCSSHSSRT